ncbi:MAG: iron chelate uptake ABC transporter family permease subunit [Actinomycetaceae bacterium]|nr:iron chelate uptake ABC transporter family permease subunit [Actinomycetaceae bacterium]
MTTVMRAKEAAATSPATNRPGNASKPRYALWLTGGLVVVAALALWSITVGTANMSVRDILTGNASAEQLRVLTVSRIPRTIAIILSGASMAVAGLVMQMLVQNRYVEPSTTGVTESAGLGVLVVTFVFPGASIMAKMGFSVVFALAGTMLLLALIRSIPHRDVIVVPLLGIVLSGVIGAGATFLAWQFQLQGTLQAWTTGDFSGVLKGRYELLWVVAGASAITYFFADRFTVAGLGEDLARNLGLNHARLTMLGLTIVAIVAGIVTVVAGALPFLGLVVPNIVSLIMGDYMRRSLPFVAMGGAVFVLVADIIGRSIIAPAEIPVGVVMGIVGGAIFLFILLRTVKQ